MKIRPADASDRVAVLHLARRLAEQGTPAGRSERQVARWVIERRRHATPITVPGCRHAPALNTAQRFASAERFLAGHR
ncbi:MAG: hypothetical protein JF586_17850 [Burkholderiales bacterium]|nr:hypothetical protein [Burkholderiales bacterium]